MSSDLIKTERGVQVTKFWGGVERGTCIQISTPFDFSEHQPERYVQLSAQDVKDILPVLVDFMLFNAPKEGGNEPR